MQLVLYRLMWVVTVTIATSCMPFNDNFKQEGRRWQLHGLQSHFIVFFGCIFGFSGKVLEFITCLWQTDRIYSVLCCCFKVHCSFSLLSIFADVLHFLVMWIWIQTFLTGYILIFVKCQSASSNWISSTLEVILKCWLEISVSIFPRVLWGQVAHVFLPLHVILNRPSRWHELCIFIKAAEHLSQCDWYVMFISPH